MSRFDHDRMMTILADALDLPAPRRVAFLDSTCGGEPELRREIDELLEGERLAAECFDVASEQIAHADPQRIGPYTAVETLGEGGMAIVYKAEQRHPVRRTVAIKLIKLGMDTRQFVARFEAERQALALMDHPNVARVYDAGAIESGRPYFVMEYVPGRPINEYCDERGLGVRHRLEVFLDVCDAVEHAHRKGVLHRDIKNSNVLVTERDGQPVPKVIDFGVAKALQQPLTERTLQTELGQLIGTPEYMSPEQAERGALGDIDTRSDVYSLGVLLYELIAGVQPIASDALRGADQEQVRRVIRESEPTRPSTRLSTLAGADATRIAQRRRTALPTLIRELRSELEWIPLKAMRKDREQRYRSAAELADDVRNYLAGRPLTAGPESRAYRARKFLHRHRAGVAALAAIVFLLITGIVATSWQAYRARQAEARTAAERDRAHETLAFLTNDVLAGATPEKIPDAKVRDQIVGALIMPAAKRVGEVYAGRPLTEAGVREAIQGVLRDVGRADLALPHAEAALARSATTTRRRSNPSTTTAACSGRSVEMPKPHRCISRRWSAAAACSATITRTRFRP
jgi:serine/threonine protein kinase